MLDFRRYSVFYAPPEGSALARFGADWLGWDAQAGIEVPASSACAFTHEKVTRRPRRYGFHGTLKAPFRLADGFRFDDLSTAMAELAASAAPFDCSPLEVAELGAFLALCPSAPCARLDALAARCLIELDRFRAPPGADELARRRAGGLTPVQEANLDRWGYPHVLGAFRFHMTLTGPLDPGNRATVAEEVRRRAGAFLEMPLAVREICLFGEASAPPHRFRILRRYALSGASPG